MMTIIGHVRAVLARINERQQGDWSHIGG